MAISTNYTNLSELERFKSGYIIVEDTLFEVDKGTISDSWSLSSKSIEDKVAEARTAAELSNRKRIVYDDEEVYSAAIVADEGELLTASESRERMDPEERDDFDSFCEHFLDR